jgi:hypothetical protein
VGLIGMMRRHSIFSQLRRQLRLPPAFQQASLMGECHFEYFEHHQGSVRVWRERLNVGINGSLSGTIAINGDESLNGSRVLRQ